MRAQRWRSKVCVEMIQPSAGQVKVFTEKNDPDRLHADVTLISLCSYSSNRLLISVSDLLTYFTHNGNALVLQLWSVTNMDEIRLGWYENAMALSLKCLHIHRGPGNYDSARHVINVMLSSARVSLEPSTSIPFYWMLDQSAVLNWHIRKHVDCGPWPTMTRLHILVWLRLADFMSRWNDYDSKRRERTCPAVRPAWLLLIP